MKLYDKFTYICLGLHRSLFKTIGAVISHFKGSQLKWARIAQLVTSRIFDVSNTGSSLTDGGVFFWYWPLARPSLQIASVGSEHYGKNNGGWRTWIVRVKITPRL